MFRCSDITLKSYHSNARYFSRSYRGFAFRHFDRWQRGAQGMSKWDHQQSHRMPPKKRQFFGHDPHVSKGTTPEAYRWWGTQRHHLPHLPGPDYEEPVPVGKRAWPAAWTDAFAGEVTALSDEEIKEFLLEVLTTVIFEETQKDGFELRRVDFEGKPMTDLPERKLIEEFLLDEPALKDRVVQKVLEETFAISPTSEQRAEIKDVPNLIRFVQAFIGRCRQPASAQEPVTQAVQEFLAKEMPVQPLFGFQHALPQDDRPELLIKWERQFQHPWQFGNALYEPRNREPAQLRRANGTWLKMEAEWQRRKEFDEYVKSGQAKADHTRTIEEAQQAEAQGTVAQE